MNQPFVYSCTMWWWWYWTGFPSYEYVSNWEFLIRRVWSPCSLSSRVCMMMLDSKTDPRMVVLPDGRRISIWKWVLDNRSSVSLQLSVFLTFFLRSDKMIAATLSLISNSIHADPAYMVFCYLFWLSLRPLRIPKTQRCVIFPLCTLRQLGTQMPPKSSRKD